MLELLTVPTFTFEAVDKLLSMFEGVGEIKAGMSSEGEASAYALVWELGNVHQVKKGPKTTQGVTPDGGEVWLSIKAPSGYIRVNQQKYWNALTSELKRANFNQRNSLSMRRELERIAVRTMRTVVDITQETVPVDSGALRDSLKVVRPGNPLLDEDDESYTLVIEG